MRSTRVTLEQGERVPEGSNKAGPFTIVTVGPKELKLPI